MKILEGKSFSITDPNDIKTIVYQVNITEKEKLRELPKYTLERLNFSKRIVDEKIKKTFYIDNPLSEGNQLLILSFGRGKVIINTGLLKDDKVKIAKKALPLKFDTIKIEKNNVEYTYNPNSKRQIIIIDPDTAEEIKPELYFDEKSNEIKGKCILKPYKSYFSFEVRE